MHLYSLVFCLSFFQYQCSRKVDECIYELVTECFQYLKSYKIIY